MTALGLIDRIAGLVIGAFVTTMAWAALLTALLPVVPGLEALVAGSPLAQVLLGWLTIVSGAGSAA